MPDIIAAADETAASNLIHAAETTLGTLSKSGSGSLGPFTASWFANASFSGGMVDLIVPNVIRIANCQMNYSIGFNFSFDCIGTNLHGLQAAQALPGSSPHLT